MFEDRLDLTDAVLETVPAGLDYGLKNDHNGIRQSTACSSITISDENDEPNKPMKIVGNEDPEVSEVS